MSRPIINYPHTENDVSSILFLEENYLKDKKNKKILTKLIEKYTKLISFYDAIKDPIKLYFIDKMQTIFFDRDLFLKKSKNKNFKNPGHGETEKIMESRNKSILKTLKIIDKDIFNGKKIYDLRKNQKIKKFHFLNLIEKENENKKNDLVNKIDNFEKRSVKKTNMIKNQLKTQADLIAGKLKERRKRSISKSIKKTQESFFCSNNSMKNIFSQMYPKLPSKLDVAKKINFNNILGSLKTNKKNINEYFGENNN